jgi:uncharacterized protein YuzB (UPF0349 family)
MKLSEFIAKAEAALKEHGDIPVMAPDSGCGCCRTGTYESVEGEIVHEIQGYTGKWELSDIPLAYVVS